ncbi:MAG: hypothetical protein ABI947_01995 [Chloroflexota bacterium]
MDNSPEKLYYEIVFPSDGKPELIKRSDEQAETSKISLKRKYTAQLNTDDGPVEIFICTELADGRDEFLGIVATLAKRFRNSQLI